MKTLLGIFGVVLILAIAIGVAFRTGGRSGGAIATILRGIERTAGQLANRIEYKQQLKRELDLEEAHKSGQIVSVNLPYRDIQNGEWRKLEDALSRLCRSNNVQIVHLEEAGHPNAKICVWAKDAPMIRKSLANIIKTANDRVQ